MLPTHNLAVCPICTEDPANVKVPRAKWECACGGNNEKWAQRTSGLSLRPPNKREWREGECSECGDANAVIEVGDFLCKACRWHRDNPMHDDGHTVTFTLEGRHPVDGWRAWQLVPHVRCPMSEDERDGAPCAIPNAGCLVEALFGDGDSMEHYIDPIDAGIALGAKNRIAWSYSSHYNSYFGDADEEFFWRLLCD